MSARCLIPQAGTEGLRCFLLFSEHQCKRRLVNGRIPLLDFKSSLYLLNVRNRGNVILLQIRFTQLDSQPCGRSIFQLLAVVGVVRHIEASYPYEEQVAVIANEEGKLLDLPYNRPLLDEHGVPYDIVCGTFFVAGLSCETFTSLTEDQLRCYKELFDNHIVLTVPAQNQPEKTHPKKGKKYER